MKTQNTPTGAANTTAARHTLGPWVASGSAVLAKIADSTRGFLPPVVSGEGLAHLPIDEKQANARLISAAPELLEACRYFEATLAGLSPAERDALPNDIMNVSALTSVAIAKIEG